MKRIIAACVILLGLLIPVSGMSEDIWNLKEKQLSRMPGDTARVNLLIDLGIHYCSRENDRALLFLQQALALSGEIGYQRGIGLSYLWQGRVYYYKDHYEMTESYLQKSRPFLEKAGIMQDMAWWYFADAALNDLNGNFIQAVKDYQEVIRLTSKTGDESLRATCLVSVGSINNRMKDPVNARVYYREALLIEQRIGDRPGLANTFTCIGGSFEEQGLFDSAGYYYQKGYQLRMALQDSRSIANSEYNLGTLSIKTKRFNEAVRFLESAIARYINLEEQTGLCIATCRLGEALNGAGDKAAAETRGQEALAIAKRLGNNELIAFCYESLASVSASNHRFREAYQYTLLLKEVNELLNRQKREKVIREMEARFHVQRMNSEMENLLLQSKAQRKNIILLTVILVTLATILVLTILLFRLKVVSHRRQKKLYAQDAIIREQQDSLAEKEKMILHDKIESQNRELAAKALEMLRVNETLSRIIGRLRVLNHEGINVQRLEKEIEQIVRDIEFHTQNNAWQEFDTIFRNIHSSFYEKLLQLCPDLTASEIKIAALLKLNLSTKEIAAITLRSEEGIKSTRYRLRKKLNFSSDEHLIPFLMQL